VKKILVAIDFSPSTKQTMDFAMIIAEQLNSRLLVLNVIDFMEKTVGLKSVNKVLHEDATIRLEKFLTPYKKKTEIKILSKIVKGDAYTVISRQAQINGVDMIILGAQGEDNEDRYFLGKVAGSLIKFTNLPVIAVPKKYQPRDTKSILFMFRRLNKSLFEIINPLLEISKSGKVKVHAVHLTGAQTGHVAYSPELIFQGIDYDYEDLNKDSFTDGINHKLTEINVDMICVIKRKRGILEYIFESSPTSKDIIDSPVPVLFLNDDE